MAARSVGAQSRQAEQASEQFLFNLQNLNASPRQAARTSRQQAVAAMQVTPADRKREAVEPDDRGDGRKDHGDQDDGPRAGDRQGYGQPRFMREKTATIRGK